MTIDWQEVLGRALAGDAEAFGVFYQGYLRPKMERLAQKILKNEEDVRDIVQEIFVYLFEESRYLNIRNRYPDGFSAYVLQTTQAKCLDYRKKQIRVRFFISDDVIQRLACEAVADDVLQRVKHLQSHLEKPVGKQKFLDLLKDAFNTGLTERLKALLLRYCRQEYPYQTPLSEPVMRSYPGKRIPLPEKELSVDDRLEELLTAVQNFLDDHERALLHKKVFLNSSYREIAGEQGIPISTLQSQYARILKNIRQHERFCDLWQLYWTEREGDK